MATLPPFEHTPIESLPGIAAGIRATFLSHKTRPLEYRIQQLRKLYWGLKDYKDTIIEACKKDLGKPAFETFIGEVNWVMNDCIYLSQNLKRFAKDEKPEDVDFTNKIFGPRIRKDPMGTVLILGYVLNHDHSGIFTDIAPLKSIQLPRPPLSWSPSRSHRRRLHSHPQTI